MFWLSRPPYLRWTLAAVVAAVGIWSELAPQPHTEHPFATEPIPAGALVTTEMVEMRDVPEGLFGPVDLPSRTLAPVAAGAPLVASSLGNRDPVPAGWWTIALPVPSSGTPGTAVRVVVDDGHSVTVFDGILVSTAPGEYGGTEGLIALPEDAVAAVGSTRAEVTVFTAG